MIKTNNAFNKTIYIQIHMFDNNKTERSLTEQNLQKSAMNKKVPGKNFECAKYT